MDISELNAQQQRAVLDSVNQNTVVLAGAGSGKTKTLTFRCAYLMDDMQVPPESIMAVTFTNKAAGEMKARLRKIAPQVDKMWMGTFHSICVKILHRFGKSLNLNKFTIMDKADARSLLRQAFKDCNEPVEKKTVAQVADRIGKAKSNLMSPAEMLNRASDAHMTNHARIYKAYQNLCWSKKCLDFDDLLVYTVVLLQRDQQVRDWFHQNISYLMVDESQDTNPAQFELIKLIVGNNNLFLVGDDWQSIYSFRSANPKYIMEFQNLYANALVIRLEQNYRSTKTIVDASNAVIKQNTVRTDKTMFSAKGMGDPILVHEEANPQEEAYWIAKEIAMLRRRGVPLQGMAVLYRTNAQSRPIEEKLLSFTIPYKVVGGLAFYDRKEIKDVMAFIRLYLNPKDEMAFRRILGLMPGIGKKTIDEMVIAFQSQTTTMNALQAYVPKTQRVRDSIHLLMNLYQLWSTKGQDFLTMVESMLLLTGYERDLVDEDTEDSHVRLENLNEFKNVVAEFMENDPAATLQDFADQIALSTTDEEDKTAVDRVNLMTLHGAKGLEFPYVFMPGCEESVIPHANSMYSQDAIEEERRLFYVGMTRAERQLFLTHTIARKDYAGNISNNPESRFLNDIPKQYKRTL